MIEIELEQEDMKTQRLQYGVSDEDVFSFYHYLTHVLANGLELLDKSTHGCPSSYYEKYGEENDLCFYEWKKDLQRISFLCGWLARYDDISSDLHSLILPHMKMDIVPGENKIELDNEELTDSTVSFTGHTEQDYTRWREYDSALAQRRDQILIIVMDWLKEHFFELWD